MIAALAEELARRAPLLDRDAFRAVAARVRERTGQKGKALFHPIRLALTGEPEGLELDLAVPAIERGAALRARRSGAASLRRDCRRGVSVPLTFERDRLDSTPERPSAIGAA